MCKRQHSKIFFLHRFSYVFWLLVLGLLGPEPPAQAGSPPDTPFLRIETGMHTTRISRIGVDAAERYLVTASDDKTARVWDLATGKLLQVLRVPLGPGNEGKLYAVAISPDGATVATAGWTGYAWDDEHSIYLFDRASGRLKQRITGLPNVIHHLAYSPDGRYLAAALGQQNGIRIYRTSDYDEVARDTGYGGASYWAEFDRRGRLVTTCEDSYIRLYDSDFRLIAKQQAPGGKDPFTASFSPDSDKVAVGFSNSTAVNMLSGKDLSFLYAPDNKGVDNGDLFTVAWSLDGQMLYAGGRYDESGGINPILKWTQAGRGSYTALSASTDTIMDIRPLAEGWIVFGAGDPVFGVFDATGRKVLEQRPVIVDHRDNEDKLRISQDGSIVQFGFNVLTPQGNWSKRLARLDFSQRRLELEPSANSKAPKLSPPRTTAPGLDITDWNDTEKPRLNGKVLELKPYETSRSLAIAPDNKHFLLGTEWYLRPYDRQGREQRQISIPSEAWAVNISGDGKLAIAALGDGTLRWYRLEDGAEVLAFFPHADGQRWIAWTPEGFFDAAGGGEKLIGYHLNQGPDKEGEFVKVDQLYKLFYRPDLVAKRLQGGHEQTIQEELARIGNVRQVLAGNLPPELELLSPAEVRQKGRDFTLRFRVKEQSGGVGNIIYRINGVTVGTPQARPIDIWIPGRQPVNRPFTLNPGKNIITATVYNAKNEVESQPIEAIVHVEQRAEEQPALYVLALGVTAYRDRDLQLKYPADDAKAVVEELQRRGQGLFRSTQVKLLLNEQATLAGIEAAFNELAKQIKETDVFVLYLAGHGLALEGNYHFIPWDLIYANSNELRRQSLDQDKLQKLLATIPALKSLVILDTCNAGAFTTLAASSRGDLGQKTAIDRLMRATGRAVLASSSEQQFALEGYKGHGVFTYALLEGLRGQANRDNNDHVSIDELADFVAQEVPRITRERWRYEQFPMWELRGMAFPLSLTKP